VSVAPVAIGRAVSTTSGSLPCQHVLHAPTMKNPVEQTSKKTVLRATKAALKRGPPEALFHRFSGNGDRNRWSGLPGSGSANDQCDFWLFERSEQSAPGRTGCQK